MEPKRKHRTVIRSGFTRNANELERLIGETERDVRKVQVSWELLQQKFECLNGAEEAVYHLLLEEDASEEDLEREIESRDVYREKFTQLKYAVEDLLHPAPSSADAGDTEAGSNAAGCSRATSDGNGSSVGTQGRRKFKLPKIEFKKYDGNIRDWLPFWSQFQKIHEDPNIDDSDKVQYLIQSTVEGSRARQVVESFPATGANYSNIVETLHSRFGREDLQIEVHVRELLGLIINNAISKKKMVLFTLYDRLATQLRALETLGIASDKCSAMLFPMIESCLPQELLRAWQRSRTMEETGVSVETRLQGLMRFLQSEVENEEKISLAAHGFGLNAAVVEGQDKLKKQKSSESVLPTAGGLVNFGAGNKCLFCEGSHASDSCFKARNMTLEQKRKILSGKGACFKCLKIGHHSARCRGRMRCILCNKNHVSLMCPELDAKRSVQAEVPAGGGKIKEMEEQSLANLSGPQVFLQTLKVKARSDQGLQPIRVLIDTGSERSYILKSTALKLGYVVKKTETIIHALFGGAKMEQKHCFYDVRLCSNNYACKFEVMDQPVICAKVRSVVCGPWTPELEASNIKIDDCLDSSPIELLIGADVAGKLYTGRRLMLKCGLVATETLLGWTLMGRIPEKCVEDNCIATALSLLLVDSTVADLWKMDVLGITDPIETKSRRDKELAAKDLFSQTIRVDTEGRYEVRLPWMEEHPPLPSNFGVAKRRLEGTVKRLKNDGLFAEYDAIFNEWLTEGVIERVFDVSTESCHYLPHRPVVKNNSLTTRIRPVFDASAKEKNRPSINQCLEKGPNLIELIPSVLLRFRINKIGIVTDIRKAFLQISVNESDRNFLRFLWTDGKENLKIFRHKRVVFGISSSPFLLGATIEHHLMRCLEACHASATLFSRDTCLKLLKSFYVDNCVTSLPNGDALRQFVKESVDVMASGKFDLRGWESPYFADRTKDVTAVLGLIWRLDTDELKINEDCLRDLQMIESRTLTKRVILSVTQKIFDPIGFSCPVTLIPKMLLQEIWGMKIGWDTPIREDCGRTFLEWAKELPHLLNIAVPRWVDVEPTCSLSVHTFCDASAHAYSTVIFLRIQNATSVTVHLLAAKARVAPLEKVTIPRLELLAALIGARLSNLLKNELEGEIKYLFWTDSTTVLSWIQRKEEWSTFVRNRVAEIRELTRDGEWRHVPGILNPADLPSRGCSPKQLVQSKWWEGPLWLREAEDCWPKGEEEFNEDEIAKERKKKAVSSLLSGSSDEWHLAYFSKYSKTLRMMTWVLRFCHNLRDHGNKKRGVLSTEELEAAERFIVKVIQSESFGANGDERLSTLAPFRDEERILRVRTRIWRREDSEDFRFPIVLPAGHKVIDGLIQYTHEQSCHVGTDGLLSLIREKFWILGGRRTIRRVIAKCTVCKRQTTKAFAVPEAPLPRDRVRDAMAFEVVGVDFAGPLYMKNGTKAWICLFSCAVYRCVHLELVTSLSTSSFLQVLRRFVARRGRPRVIYSDNGTNFVGAENAFEQLDWEKIKEETAVQRIMWRFNPPSAPWWGGFWERLIGVLKGLLKKMLGKSSLDYEDLLTLICDCEAVVNSRPLTYQSNDPKELIALTPAMFLNDQTEYGVPEIDAVEASSLCRKRLHLQRLREDLRKRFRNEYLGQLKLLNQKAPIQFVSVGDVVLVGHDNNKRINWPMGRVVELIPGADGKVRLVRVQTSNGQLLRPLQRLYPLECISKSAGVSEVKKDLESRAPVKRGVITEEGAGACAVEESVGTNGSARSVRNVKEAVPPLIKVTRSGRITKLPQRYM